MHWLTAASEDQLKVYLAAVGLIAGIAGGVIGFISNQVATTRQIRRQERDSRRGIYRDYLHTIVNIRRLMQDQTRAVGELDSLASAARNALLSSEAEPVGLSAKHDALKAETRGRSERITSLIEDSLLLTYDLWIFAPSFVVQESKRIETCLAALLATPANRTDNAVALAEAQSKLFHAEARFINYIRADLKAPDAPNRHAIPFRMWLIQRRERRRGEK